MIRALAALATELERNGWERVGRDEEGLEHRDRRPVNEYLGAAEVGGTIAEHQLDETVSQRMTEQAAEPVPDEITTGELELVEPLPVERVPAEWEAVEPLLIERVPAEPDRLELGVLEPPVRLEVSASDVFDPEDVGPTDSEPRTTEPEPESDEPWFARPRMPQEASESETADTILVDRISAYSFDG